MASRLLNEGPKWVIFTIWLLINIGLFIGYFFKFHNDIEWYYLNQILGLPLPFARASAACLNFNCMLILLPVCRNLLSFVRGSICCCCKRNLRRQLDKNIAFHKMCAYMIVVQTAIHYYAHTYNIERFIEAHNSPNNVTRGLLSTLTILPVTENGTWINPLRNPQTNPMLEVVRIVPGYTGLLITIPLILIVTSATEVIRRSYFELFWYTHHLFVVFFVALVAHGVGGLVRSQTNVDAHDPLVCSSQYRDWGKTSLPECPIPQFGHKGAQTWVWVVGPMVLYLIERIIRFVRSQQTVNIVKVVEHPSRVLELQMQKKGFKAESGMYIFLHCPDISQLEWHPFTLTSSPQEDYFSVHVRLVGDWTNELADKCKEGGKDGSIRLSEELPRMAIDGPFGTASEDVYRYQTVMLVAAGIGVTPFASILKDIWYRYTSGDTEMKTQKIYFVWICPDTNAFEWFVDLLKSVESQMAERGQMDFLKYYLCLTRGVDSAKMANILVRSQSKADPVTGLQQGTYYGKPDWDAMFGEISQAHKGTRIGVFFCGPKGISTQLHKMSNKHSSASDGTGFVYNKENF